MKRKRTDLSRLDELTPNAMPRRQASAKRKADFDSPLPRKVSKPDMTAPRPGRTAMKAPVEAAQYVQFRAVRICDLPQQGRFIL